MHLKDPFIFFPILILANSIAYVLNIVISKIWDRNNKQQIITQKKDIFYSLFILTLNIIVVIPGFLLWHKEIIKFTDSHFFLSFISLFLLIDLLMYFSHWLSHNLSPLKKIHSKHHEHATQFNPFSLYYMSPWESLLFGVLLTIVPIFFSFNLYAFIIFIVFNWFYGVITHLNVSKNRSSFLIFTTNTFHLNHHQLNYKNYGFYTFIWDKIFKTEFKS